MTFNRDPTGSASAEALRRVFFQRDIKTMRSPLGRG